MTANRLTRRGFTAAAAAALLPVPARARGVREIDWEDLIPPGVPYSEIIGEGEIDRVNDTWNPIFDANGIKLNTALDGQQIKLPGYIVPLATTRKGVTDFILVPYLGACTHVPPPPPNQLVFVTARKPWPTDLLWDAIWVSGTLRARLQSTEIAQIGYEIAGARIELYQW